MALFTIPFDLPKATEVTFRKETKDNISWTINNDFTNANQILSHWSIDSDLTKLSLDLRKIHKTLQRYKSNFTEIEAQYHQTLAELESTLPETKKLKFLSQLKSRSRMIFL
jgi:uncharacterized protein (DUF3084 family)